MLLFQTDSVSDMLDWQDFIMLCSFLQLYVCLLLGRNLLLFWVKTSLWVY